jgi:hypothetical protein
MSKKVKKVKIKHYFTLTEEVNEKFEKYIKDNVINKPKLIENLVIQYLLKNKINLD